MSKLYVTQKYYDKFIEGEAKKVIQLYGFSDRDEYFKEVCKFLNEVYSWLDVEGIEIMSPELASEYSMYNGFIAGTFTDYDEVIVSFSDPYTKEGNTIISQQVMPMLQKKISNDLNFEDAIKQYKTDRTPDNLLFHFKRCIVHFAVDDIEVHMCTELKGQKSFFLPFNNNSLLALTYKHLVFL